MADDIDLVIDQGETITVSVEDAGPDADVIVTLGTGGGGGVTSISDVVGLQAALDGKASTTDARFTDSREWIADTVSQAEAEAGTATTRRAWTALRVFQAVAAWWAASSAKSKLDGIATGATANATDAQLRDRSTHTGTQLRATISDFAHAFTHGSGGTDPITVAQSQVTGLATALSGKADASTPTLTGQVTFAGDNSTTGTINGDAAYFSTLVFANLTTQTTAFTSTLKTKLDGIASGATANATDAQLRDRSTHTGTQAAGTITGLAAVATSGSASDLTAGTVAAARLPAATTTTSGAVVVGSGLSVSSGTVSANVTSVAGRTGAVTIAAADVSGLAASATTDTTSATNITSGTLPAARLPATTVTAASYGSASSVATFTVGADGRLTAAGSTAISVAASAIASGTVATARLASGTASSSTFLRGDQTWAAAPVTSVDGSTGDIVVTKAAIYDFLRGSAPSGATGNGDGWTWSLPSWAKWIQIYAVGGGSGGASGRRGASGSLAGGGGGGCGGFVSQTFAIVSDLGASTLWIAVGAGGAGGAAQTANDTNGNGGTAGGQCYIRVSSSSGAVILAQDLFAFGSNGGTSSGGGGVTGSNGSWNVGNGAQSAAGGDGTTAVVSPSLATNQLAGPSGGGGGGGISSGNSAQAGGSTNWPYRGRFSDGQPVGASGGAVGAAGSNGGTSAYAFCGRVGIGGGGGGSSTTAAGGSGGNGGFPGGGGGGGGASRNGFNSGAGGNGGDGLVRIIVWG